MRVLFMSGIVALAALTAPAGAQVFHDETVDGDLSGDGFNPTAYTLGQGTHSLLARTGANDIEYLALTIPQDAALAQIILVSYVGEDPVAFIGVMNGPQFTELPNNPHVENLLGWAHFGPDFGHVGTDILDDIGQGGGAIGFTPPLPAGTYSFWIQQIFDPMAYQLDFVVIPAPASVAALVVAAPLFMRRRRR